MTHSALCKVSELPDGGSRGFCLDNAPHGRRILLVRMAGNVYAYVNKCPHTGVNLDWVPDQFLDMSGRFIQCATHGALFRIDDGYCVAGPCTGGSLTAVAVRIREGIVEIAPDSPASGPARI